MVLTLDESKRDLENEVLQYAQTKQCAQNIYDIVCDELAVDGLNLKGVQHGLIVSSKYREEPLTIFYDLKARKFVAKRPEMSQYKIVFTSNSKIFNACQQKENLPKEFPKFYKQFVAKLKKKVLDVMKAEIAGDVPDKWFLDGNVAFQELSEKQKEKVPFQYKFEGDNDQNALYVPVLELKQKWFDSHNVGSNFSFDRTIYQDYLEHHMEDENPDVISVLDKFVDWKFESLKALLVLNKNEPTESLFRICKYLVNLDQVTKSIVKDYVFDSLIDKIKEFKDTTKNSNLDIAAFIFALYSSTDYSINCFIDNRVIIKNSNPGQTATSFSASSALTPFEKISNVTINNNMNCMESTKGHYYYNNYLFTDTIAFNNLLSDKTTITKSFKEYLETLKGHYDAIIDLEQLNRRDLSNTGIDDSYEQLVTYLSYPIGEYNRISPNSIFECEITEK